MKLLVTGFEPFLQFRVNSSWEAVRELDGQHVGPFDITCRRLPVAFDTIDGFLAQVLDEVQPTAVLAFGLAPSPCIRLERLAVNVDWSERRDNAGLVRSEAAIRSNGALGLATVLPLPRMVERLRRRGFPATLSFHAGTYLCNHVYYRLLETTLPAAFIHVPPISLRWPRRRLSAAARLVVTSAAAYLDQGRTG